MPIDFTGFERPEVITEEMLSNDALLKFINDSIDKQIQASVSTHEEKLTKATRDKAIAEQKVADIQVKLTDAIAQGTGSEAVDKLKAQLARAKEDAATEYTAQIDALKAELDEKKSESEKLSNELMVNATTSFMRDSINEYNAKNPALKTVDGSEKYLIEAGLKVFKKTDEGEFRAFDGEKPLTSASGFMTGPEFISSLRDDSSARLFFNQPTGGGAAGGKGGATDNWSEYFTPGKINLTKQAELKKDNPALFKQLSQK